MNDETDAAEREALIRARAEVMETMRRHGLAGFCVLGAGGSLEVVTALDAPWCKLAFVCNADGDPIGLHLRASVDEDYGGDQAAMQRDIAFTAGFASAMGEVLGHTAVKWLDLSKQIDEVTGAEHTGLQRVHTQ